MITTTLVRPSRLEQAAALMLTVFQANPNIVMTRREVESLVDVSEFSDSTRQRALWHLCGRGRPLGYDTGDSYGGRPTTYWLKKEESA